MVEFFRKLFGGQKSSETAKNRLRLVLLSDHLSLAPDVVDAMKADLLEVISRYVEIDETHAEVSFEHREREIAMLASIPIRSVRPQPLRPKTAVPAITASAERNVLSGSHPTDPAEAETPSAPKRRRRRRKKVTTNEGQSGPVQIASAH